MSTQSKSVVKLLLIINLVFILPALYGIVSLAVMHTNYFDLIVYGGSLTAGIVNGVYLFVKRHSKHAWIFNFGMSCYAIFIWTTILILKNTGSFHEEYLLMFIWPVIMLGTSWYVLSQYSVQHRSNHIVF